MSTENALLTILVEKIQSDSLVLPTLPEIAIKIREAADDPDVNLHMMANVISQDPALSARLVKVANSAFMGRSVKVDSLNQAVTRIGLRQIKNIATAIAMEQLFVSKNELVREYMQKSWEKTVNVACVAIATMQKWEKGHKHTSINIDTLTLAALVHSIGVLPILTEAERHEEVFANPSFLEAAIKRMGGKLGGAIMRSWGFSGDFIEIAEKWNDLEYKTQSVSYIDFVRVGALYHDVLCKGQADIDKYEFYVEKGVVEDIEYFKSDEFNKALLDIKSVFS
ncbi:HDOD domain-containing protein [Psychrosphaera aestuarii]|uniref:HDOD domain-containing protein n=1 Tax=Psychrosphaera aestuarii TaxID=1266052 RepID=UPI001B33FFDE|nr:HDOD domain-containing protein [Psychrosphaera aestuarii]